MKEKYRYNTNTNHYINFQTDPVSLKNNQLLFLIYFLLFKYFSFASNFDAT